VLEQFQFEKQADKSQAEIGAGGIEYWCAPDVRADAVLGCGDLVSSDGWFRHGCRFLIRLFRARPLDGVAINKTLHLVLLCLGSCLIVYMNLGLALRAIANDRRLRILAWLKNPRKHFRPQADGDLVKDGVCGVLIAEKLGVSQPTASVHMKILVQAGLVRAKRIKQWTFYRRDEPAIHKIKRLISAKV
jgi:DNA-binding transcriptional ArsR family regulator